MDAVVHDRIERFLEVVLNHSWLLDHNLRPQRCRMGRHAFLAPLQRCPSHAHRPATTSTLRGGFGSRSTPKFSTHSSALLVSGLLHGDFAIYTGGHTGGLEMRRRSSLAYGDSLVYIEGGSDCRAQSSSPKRQMPQRSALRTPPYLSQLARSPIHPQLGSVHHLLNPGRWTSSYG